jgi:3-oxoacyl-[acyl-carrier-protein] synthase II
MKNVIVITGIGVVSPIGDGKEKFVRNLLAGTNGRKPIERFDVSDPAYRSKHGATIDSQYTDVHHDPTKIAHLTLVAAREAIEDSAILFHQNDPYRIGLSIGTSHGSNHTLIRYIRQKINSSSDDPDYSLLMNTFPSVAGKVAADLGIRGPVYTFTTACSSGTVSIGNAMDLLMEKEVDIMIAGGTDIFSELTFSGFNALKSLTPDEVRPLSATRQGLLLGEGAAIFVLERKQDALNRGARIYAELPGYAIMNEAYHETAPDPTGENAYHVMLQAIRNAGIQPEDIDYINVHGTGTPANDSMELKAVKKLMKDHLQNIKVSSTKSMIGHALGAAGSLELAATVLCMKKGYVPPTINFEQPIEEMEHIDVVPHQAQKMHVTYALSNSFAFAGHLASIVIKNQ